MAGEKLKFKTPEELSEAIESYFKKCDLSDTPYTVTGLALDLGFLSRQSIYDYATGKVGQENSSLYSYTTKKALLKVENYAERMLYSKHSTGAIFALKNRGWSDKHLLEHSGSITNKNIDMSKLSIKELEELERMATKAERSDND